MHRLLVLAVALQVWGTMPVAAHDGVVHKTPEEARAHRAGTSPEPPLPTSPFPVDITADYALTDHFGQSVTSEDMAGQTYALFFGYASCEAICSVAMPTLGQALDILEDEAIPAMMITVDPARDTLEAMQAGLSRWHADLVGLTGSDRALAHIRDSFQIEASHVYDDAEHGAVFAHGSFIYLIGPDGKVATVMPPILGPERMAAIIRNYL